MRVYKHTRTNIRRHRHRPRDRHTERYAHQLTQAKQPLLQCFIGSVRVFLTHTKSTRPDCCTQLMCTSKYIHANKYNETIFYLLCLCPSLFFSLPPSQYASLSLKETHRNTKHMLTNAHTTRRQTNLPEQIHQKSRNAHNQQHPASARGPTTARAQKSRHISPELKGENPIQVCSGVRRTELQEEKPKWTCSGEKRTQLKVEKPKRF